MKARNRANMLEFVRFAIVGGISFAADFGVLVIMQEVLGLKNSTNGMLFSVAVAYGVGLVVHYLLSVFWVFQGNHINTGRDHLQAGGLFVLTCCVGFMLTELGMWLGVRALGWYYPIVKIVVTGIVMLWNYVSQKFFVFR